ncbi:MAG: class A beta-lactamase [Chloroflexaceae bacterium]|nr:class A beta-lactamase [Chloroflexaceae bacterium]
MHTPTAAATPLFDREVARLAASVEGQVGLSAIHLETGRRVARNGHVRFPMASTRKIPIALQLLNLVDRGEVDLDTLVPIHLNDLHPGSGILIQRFPRAGLALSVYNLFVLMLVISDNSASDIVLRLAGGPEAVTSYLRGIGSIGIEVHRPTVQTQADFAGATLPPESEWSPDLFQRLFRAVPPAQKQEAVHTFIADLRDTATPDAMADLLGRIQRKEGLTDESATLLLETMRNCETGEARIKGLLPSDTIVAHKTGTMGGITNDVGIITLPGGRGHVAIAMFVASVVEDVTKHERVIAEISRAVYDYFLFSPNNE